MLPHCRTHTCADATLATEPQPDYDVLFDQRKKAIPVPDLNFERLLAELFFGFLYWNIGRYVTHTHVEPSWEDVADLGPDEQFVQPVSLLSRVLGTLGCAMGVWLAGNLGNESGKFSRAAAGAAVGAVLGALVSGGAAVATVCTVVGFNTWRSHKRVREHVFAGRKSGAGRKFCACCWLQVLFVVVCLVAISSSDSGIKVSTEGGGASFRFGGAKENAGSEYTRAHDAGSSSGSSSSEGGSEGEKEEGDKGDGSFKEPDPYEVLGVKRGATVEEIKAAYHEGVLRWHPDKNPDDVTEATRRFYEIQAAYEKLGADLGFGKRKNRRRARRSRGGGSGDDGAADSSSSSSSGSDSGRSSQQKKTKKPKTAGKRRSSSGSGRSSSNNKRSRKSRASGGL